MADTGDANRNVVVTYSVRPDKTTAETFRRMGKDAKTFESQVRADAEKTEKFLTSSRYKTFQYNQKLAQQEATERQRQSRQLEAEEDRIHSRMRSRQQQRARDNRTAREQEARDNERAAQQAVQASERAARQLETQHRRTHAAINTGIRQTLHGTMDLARSFVFLGASTEESAQKMLQSIFKVEAAIQGVRGAMHLAHGIRNLSTAAAGGSALAGAAMTALPYVAGAAAVGGAAYLGANRYINSGLEASQQRLGTTQLHTQQRVEAESSDPDAMGARAGLQSQISLQRYQGGADVAGILGSKRSAGTIAANQAVGVAQMGQYALQNRLAGAPNPMMQFQLAAADSAVSKSQIAAERSKLADAKNTNAAELSAAQSLLLGANEKYGAAVNLPTGTRRSPTADFQSYQIRSKEFNRIGGFSQSEMVNRFESQNPGKSAYRVEAMSPGRDDKIASADSERKKALEEIKRLQAEGVQLSERDRQIQEQSVQSMQKELGVMQQIKQSESERLRGSEQNFALMHGGQQHRLLRDLDRFNGGQLGNTRRGLERTMGLVQAGFLDPNDARVQGAVQNRLANIPGAQAAFAGTATQGRIEAAGKAADELLKAIGDGLKRSENLDDVVDGMKEQLAGAARKLTDALVDAMNEEMNKKVRDAATGAAAKASAKDASLN